MTGSILCGVDGSADARAALRVAAQLAGQLGIPLVVAHVVQATVAVPGVGLDAHPVSASAGDVELAAGRRLVEQLVELEGLGDVEQRVVLGFPADGLADLADDVGAEIVVVGSRGRGALKSAFLGSVSSDLLGVARCPVLVVPPGAATRADLAAWARAEAR